MLPNFLVIGAEKAGTTWLYNVLGRHPDIFLPEIKELSFFNKRDSNLNITNHYVRLGLPWYREFFKQVGTERAAGDISPMYLCDRDAPARIAKTLPGVKLIALLRDPVERAASHYWMAHNKRHVSDSLPDVIERKDEAVVQRGLYGNQIELYLRHFPRENMLILIYEEVMSERETALREICRFLGVDPNLVPASNVSRKVNAATSYRMPWLYNASVALATRLRRIPILSWLPRFLKRSGFNEKVKALNAVEFDKPALTQEERLALRTFYAADREKLEALLGRKIEAWPR